MIQHMVLSMLTPILLLLGAPITLALRALRPADRGGRGPRELLVTVLHSRFLRVLASPLVSLPLFLASLYGLYFSPLFDDLMSTQIGHTVMLCHFLAVGLLFFWPLIGLDPAPHRQPYLLRILELFIGMPFHAFFGIAIMGSSGLTVHAFAHPPAAWGIDPLADEQTGGAIAWAFSEVPTLLVLVALGIQWARSDQRLSRRQDRAADRDGDAELAAYNAYLASFQPRPRGTTT
jgi:putative copper resistance protein D